MPREKVPTFLCFKSKQQNVNKQETAVSGCFLVGAFLGAPYQGRQDVVGRSLFVTIYLPTTLSLSGKLNDSPRKWRHFGVVYLSVVCEQKRWSLLLYL